MEGRRWWLSGLLQTFRGVRAVERWPIATDLSSHVSFSISINK